MNVINEEFLNQVELLELYIKDNVAGLFGGTHRSKSYGSSCEFADYREYIPGDDIRRIDWNLFARFDKLFLRLYLDERQMHTKIYIDGSKSMDFGAKNKGEFALKVAAVLAYLSVKAMDKVSIYLINENHVETLITSIVGKDAYFASIGKLNNVKFHGDSSLSSALMPTSVGYGDGMSIIISDFLSDNDYDQIISYLRSKHRDVFCLQVLSEEELHPSYKNKTIFIDSENNSSYKKNITKDVLKAYHQALNQVTQRIQKFCASREALYMLASSSARLDHIFLNEGIKKEVIK